MSAEEGWYLADDGNTIGPMSRSELIAKLGQYQGGARVDRPGPAFRSPMEVCVPGRLRRSVQRDLPTH